MKRFSIFAVCLLALLLSTPVFGQDPQGQRAGRPQGGKKLKQMDANNDGQISRDEWKGKPRAFGRLDRNNDGAIGREEVAGAGREYGNRQLKQMDANNDGQVSRDEWKGDPEAFSRLDANNDGAITKRELKGRRRSG
jgi:Ca2+-binding EF-hand superfamily protein